MKKKYLVALILFCFNQMIKAVDKKNGMPLNAKIYVAGHTGLVGSALMHSLQEKGYKNIIVRSSQELDLCRQELVEKFFAEERPEYVFLAAAKVGGILANNKYKAEFIYDNIMIATNVIQASYKYGVKKLLNLGSSCIYPKNAPQPLKEEYLLSGPLEPTNEAYAIAKIAAIKMCRYYNEQYGTNFISIMPPNLYGPHDNFNLETGHVIPVLIRKFHLAKLLEQNNFDEIQRDLQKDHLDPISHEILEKILKKIGISREAVVLFGSGTPYREFLYVDDLVQALIQYMENYNACDIGESINIGSGSDLTIKDLAQLVKEIVGYTGMITYDTSKPDGMAKKLLDVTRMNELNAFSPVELKEGIKTTYQWYIKNSCD